MTPPCGRLRACRARRSRPPEARRVRAQAPRGAHAEPFDGRPPGGGDGPIFVVQRHSATRGCTTTCGSSATGSSRAGRCRRACRAPRARGGSPSTPRTTPWPTPRSRGRSPRASTARARWTSTTPARTRWSRSGRTAASRSGCTAPACRGTWTLVPAGMDRDERNWLLIRRRDDDAPGAVTAVEALRYEPMLATNADELPRGDGWLYEVKWDGYRAVARLAEGEPMLWSRNGNDLRERFQAVAVDLGTRAALARVRGRRRGLPPRRAGPPELLAAPAGRGRARLLRLRRARGGRRAGPRAAADRAAGAARAARRRDEQDRPDLADERRRGDAPALRDRARPGGADGEAGGVDVRARPADARLAQGQGAPAAGARDRRPHARRGRARAARVARHGLPRRRRAPRLRRQRRHGVHRRRDRPAAGPVRAAAARHAAARGAAARAAAAGAAGSSGSSPSWSPRSSSPSGRTTAASGRRPTRACATTRARATWSARTSPRPPAGSRTRPRGGRPRGARTSTRSSSPATASPRATSSTTTGGRAGVLVPHLRDRPFTMKRHPDGIDGKTSSRRTRPKHMPGVDPAAPSCAAATGDTADDRLPARRGPRRAALGRDMGAIDLHVWYSRMPAASSTPTTCSSTSTRPPTSGYAEAVQAAQLIRQLLDGLGLRGVPEDERLGGHPRLRAARPGALATRTRGCSPRASAARSSAPTRGW